MLKTKQLEVYLQLDNEAQEKGFNNYQDKREFETGNKEELEEVREIQKQIESYKKKLFLEDFKKEDKQGIYSEEEIITIYDDLIKNYGCIDENNFNIDYCLNNKDLVQF